MLVISRPPDIAASQAEPIACCSTGGFAEAASGLHREAGGPVARSSSHRSSGARRQRPPRDRLPPRVMKRACDSSGAGALPAVSSEVKVQAQHALTTPGVSQPNACKS